MLPSGEADHLVQIPHSTSSEQPLSESHHHEPYHSIHPSPGNLSQSDNSVTFAIPTSSLARFNLVMLVLAYSLVARECIHVRSSLRNHDGSYTSPLSKWHVPRAEHLTLRKGTAPASQTVSVLHGPQTCYIYREHLTTTESAVRAHIVAPKNGWATFPLNTRNPPLELVNDNLPISCCPLVASGTWYSDTSLLKQAPTPLVVSQQLWNATQVGQIFLLLCLYVTSINVPFVRMIVSATFIILAVIMPFSVYVTSPCAATFAIVSFCTAVVAAVKASDVRVTLIDLPPRVFGRRMEYTKESILMHSLFKVEFIACLCNLFSSMYNYNASKTKFPYWDHIFRSLDGLLGLVGKTAGTKMDVLDQVEYTMGLDVHMPLFVPISYGSTVGTRIFLVLWCWIPTLYVLYFGTMFVNSVKAPGRRIQQALSAMGIFHFLFLTDVVSYKFGRGMPNCGDVWVHWVERVCWRIAILLPIYQNIMTAHWKHGNRISWVGRGLHYFLAIWTVPFFIIDGMKCVWRFYMDIRGMSSANWHEMFRWAEWNLLGYHGALVLQAVVYFCMVMGWSSCHHLFTGRQSACRKKSRTKPAEFYTPNLLEVGNREHDVVKPSTGKR